MNRIRPYFLFLITLVMLPSISGCQGLEGIEGEPTLPAYIRTISIPTFANRSKTPGIEMDVTQRILHEFMSTSELAVVPDPKNADAVIQGEIYSYQKIPISWDQTNRIVQYKIRILARISFLDNKTGEIIWTVDDIDGITSYSLLASPPETEDDALFKAADELARDIFFLVFEERQFTEDDLLFSDVSRPGSVRPGEIRR